MPELSNSVSKIPQHIFRNYIIEKLRRSNPHLSYAYDEGGAVLSGAVVHVPQSGASPSVVKNRKVLPASATQREDHMVIYPLDVYTTDPTLVTWHEANEVSYDKINSVLSDHVATIMENIGDNILYNWVAAYNAKDYTSETLPAAHIIATTGAATAVNDEGQTGQRKAFTYADLQAAEALMNKQNVPTEGRYVLLESYQYQQLINSLSGNMMAAFQQAADIANGVVGKLCGFNVLQRSQVLHFTAAGVPKLPGEVLEATDNVAALCWQKDCVAKAMGETKLFQDNDSPTYYGDIKSCLVKMGGRARRSDWKGVIAIVQGTV